MNEKEFWKQAYLIALQQQQIFPENVATRAVGHYKEWLEAQPRMTLKRSKANDR